MIYHQVILDSPLFKKHLSQKAESFILSNKVVLSQTFFHETRAFMAVLDQASRRVLINNLQKIVFMIKNHGYTMTVLNQPFDVYQEATRLSRLGYKVCVITENDLLLDRLLYGSDLVDVYDLNNDRLILHSASAVCKPIRIDRSSRASERIAGIRSGTRLYLQSATSVVLGEMIGTPGCEGKVYQVVGQPDIVAKVYKKYPSPEKEDHLKRLASLGVRMNLEWCLLPKDLLYFQGKPVGFTMKRVRTEMLSNDTLYLGDDEGIEEDRLSKDRSYTLQFCLMILAQIKILNCYGISVPDFNDGNFSVFCPGHPVIMFDTDSFFEGNYFGKTVDDTCFSRNYNAENHEQLCEMCEEGALKFVFRLISLGLYPFGGRDQPYQFSDRNSQYDYRRGYFPANVLAYLGEVFTAKRLPSVSVGMQVISDALNELTVDPRKNITVRQMCLEAQTVHEPFTVSAPAEGFQTRSVSDAKSQGTAVTAANKRKHSFLPWAASLLVLMGGLVYYLCSQGILF